MMMYSRKITAHHRSQNDANYHVQQHARMAMSLLHTPFVFNVNHTSTDAASNANRMI
jgi:hypothetical protein